MAVLVFYDLWKKAQFDGSLTDTPIDFDSDTIKVGLATSSYTPSQSHDFWGDVSANEVSGTNYTAGGETVGSITVVESGGTITIDGANVSWAQSGSGFTDARYGVLYKDAGTDPLIAYIDFVSDRTNTVGAFIVDWNASGIFTAVG